MCMGRKREGQGCLFVGGGKWSTSLRGGDRRLDNLGYKHDRSRSQVVRQYYVYINNHVSRPKERLDMYVPSTVECH